MRRIKVRSSGAINSNWMPNTNVPRSRLARSSVNRCVASAFVPSYADWRCECRGLPSGRRLVRLPCDRAAVERRRAQVLVGEDAIYGMGLGVSTKYGIPVVDHGGGLFGYLSVIFLPDHGVGAVILTNSGTGAYLTGLLQRRLLEVLFDGKPEAVERAQFAKTQRIAAIAKARERFIIPADAAEVGKLAPRYVSPALGGLVVRAQDGATIFDFDKWYSSVASRRNGDGTISFILIDPTAIGFNLVVGERDGKRALIIRDAQHQYAFIAVSP